MTLLTIVSAISREFLSTMLFDFTVLPVYIIILVVVRNQYSIYRGFLSDKSAQYTKTSKELTEETIFSGLVAGFLASFVIVGIGITLQAEIFLYMFLTMGVLSFINIRYICISYAAGFLAIAVLIFRLPEISIPSLMALTAIVHITESVLIFINSGKDSIPVFIKHKNGITGAFIVERFWPLPCVFLTVAAQGMGTSFADAASVDWWPIIKTGLVGMGSTALWLGCSLTVVGYSDLAVTRQPEEKSRETALHVLCYGIILLLLAFLADRIYVFNIIGALFIIAAHEGIRFFGYYKEMNGKPIFEPVRRGLRVFDVLPGSHAQKMGMKRGDVILYVNDKGIQTEEGLKESLRCFPTFVWVQVVDAAGREKTYEYKSYPAGMNELGIISVPREKEITYNVDYFNRMGILKNLVKRFGGFNKPM